MKITEISQNINEWFSGSGPLADIVISSRIRLARNLEGYNFLTKCSNPEKSKILKKVKDTLLNIDLGQQLSYLSIDNADDLDKNLLVERHLISKNHAFGKGPRGAVVANQENFTAMINEEDHIRLQVIYSGLQLKKAYKQIDKIDDLIEKKIDYAFSTKLGYLTACPTNIGTGIRVSVMLHLPALKMTGNIKKFLNAARDMTLAVRGLFGEGSNATGDFYQLSNQVTLGVSEERIVNEFQDEIIPEIVDYEMNARKHLLETNIELLDDKISRATALLKNARLISSKEALLLLSHIRLGLNMHYSMGLSTPAIDELCRLKDTAEQKNISIKTINKLFMLTLPAHLQINHGKPLDPSHRDALRANLFRDALQQ